MPTTSPQSPQRKLLTRYKGAIHWELDETTIEKAVSFLREKEKELKKSFPGATIKLSWDDKEWEEGNVLNILAQTPETDKELDQRLTFEKEAKERKRERELAQLEALKKKYK